MNNKADAGTEITGGAFSDGTLTLMKQDGTGVDIPLPDIVEEYIINEINMTPDILEGSEQISIMDSVFYRAEVKEGIKFPIPPRYNAILNNVDFEQDWNGYIASARSRLGCSVSLIDHFIQNYLPQIVGNMPDGNYRAIISSYVPNTMQLFIYVSDIGLTYKPYIEFNKTGNSYTKIGSNVYFYIVGTISSGSKLTVTYIENI